MTQIGFGFEMLQKKDKDISCIIHCVNLHAQHSTGVNMSVDVHVACEPLCKWNKKKNIQGQDGRAIFVIEVSIARLRECV